MTKPVRHRLAHICILVKDIDRAIEHYTAILSAAAPELLEREIAKQECYAGEDRYVTAFFPAAGDACDIQLMQPLDAESPLGRRLQQRGEGVHHICFTSSHLEDTFQQLKENGVSLHGDQFITDVENPSLRWAWVLPKYAHGVLIEVMDDYHLVDGLLTKD